jgi:ElaB/YqjD/DUF883 family membrane-anchored ribosome-binding protein
MAQTNGAPSGTRDPEQIQRDIERVRGELAATVAAVAEKADLKRQAKRRVDKTRARVGERQHAVAASARENPVPLAIGGAALLALLLWLVRR